jgi:predicted DNA-binding transcriptional regulator AlpA
MSGSELIPATAPERVKAPFLAACLGVSRNTIMKWVGLGLLPEPIRLGPRTHWFETREVRAALDRRAAGTKGRQGGAGSPAGARRRKGVSS